MRIELTQQTTRLYVIQNEHGDFELLDSEAYQTSRNLEEHNTLKQKIVIAIGDDEDNEPQF